MKVKTKISKKGTEEKCKNLHFTPPDAYQMFLAESAKCVPPLEEYELAAKWKSAEGFADKVSSEDGYIPPEVYNSEAVLKPGDFSDVGQAEVLSREYESKFRYSPSTDYICYNGMYWEESKPKSQAVAQELTSRQLEEAHAEITKANTLTVGCRRNVKPELAEAKGKRLLIAAELEEGTRLSTANVKQFCSTNAIFAEKKYKEPFSYTPTHTLVLYINHLPKVQELKATITEDKANADNAEMFLKLVRKHSDIKELTAEVLREFVEKVYVYQSERVDGHKVQRIKIIYNCIGEFQTPTINEKSLSRTPKPVSFLDIFILHTKGFLC